MKNQKPKTAASASISGTFKCKGLVLRCDHRELDFEYWPRPSELELAHLAARLARTSPIDPKQLVKEAWSIYWESCQKIKKDYLEVELPLREMEAFCFGRALHPGRRILHCPRRVLNPSTSCSS
jgi:hypothetical protein